jgi:hypothetical protein
MMKGFDHLIRLGQLEISESERQMARSLLPPLLKWLLAAKNEYQNVVVYRNLQQAVTFSDFHTFFGTNAPSRVHGAFTGLENLINRAASSIFKSFDSQIASGSLAPELIFR